MKKWKNDTIEVFNIKDTRSFSLEKAKIKRFTIKLEVSYYDPDKKVVKGNHYKRGTWTSVEVTTGDSEKESKVKVNKKPIRRIEKD